MGDNHVLSPILPTHLDSDKHPDFDAPRLQRIISVIDTDAINVIFDPPIACVMRDPDGRQRAMRLGDTDALVALVFAGWSMVDCAEPGRKFEPSAWNGGAR